MSKVTSKYQVTVPRVIADHYRIRPGDDIEWVPAGESIRVIPGGKSEPPPDTALRLRLFDEATARLRERAAASLPATAEHRGWTREELYDRGRTD